jgi:hypothetical protein
MDMEVDEEVVLHPMQTEKAFTPTPDYSDYKEAFASTGTPLVIDNGTYKVIFLAWDSGTAGWLPSNHSHIWNLSLTTYYSLTTFKMDRFMAVSRRMGDRGSSQTYVTFHSEYR